MRIATSRQPDRQIVTTLSMFQQIQMLLVVILDIVWWLWTSIFQFFADRIDRLCREPCGQSTDYIKYYSPSWKTKHLTSLSNTVCQPQLVHYLFGPFLLNLLKRGRAATIFKSLIISSAQPREVISPSDSDKWDHFQKVHSIQNPLTVI